jgi:hypothetical protein
MRLQEAVNRLSWVKVIRREAESRARDVTRHPHDQYRRVFHRRRLTYPPLNNMFNRPYLIPVTHYLIVWMLGYGSSSTHAVPFTFGRPSQRGGTFSHIIRGMVAD